MDAAKRSMLWINFLGGVAVLGSYAHGLLRHPLTRDDIWGGVPEWLKPYYTISMLAAAAGYFLFTYFIFFRLDPRTTRVAGRFDFRAFNWMYTLILLPSALWMPLTFAMLDAPSAPLWAAIRIVLGLVGIGSLGLIAALFLIDADRRGPAFWLAVLGSVAFAVQTALLDALVWPAYFPL